MRVLLLSRLAVCLAAATALAGCATSDGPTASASQQFSSLPATPVSAPAPSADVKLSPGDTLTITVYQAPDLTGDVRVDGAGNFTLPLIGQIAAAGKTAHQLENEIAAKLNAKYMRSAQVTVFIKQSVGQRVVVDGQVARPGAFPITGQMTLLGAVAQAGGPAAAADTGDITVVHAGQGGMEHYSLDGIRAGKQNDPVLLAGDTVTVQKSALKSVWSNIVGSSGVANSAVVISQH